MIDKKKVEPELSLAERLEASLNSLLGRNKKLLLIVFIVIIVALVGLGIGTSISKSTLNKQFNLIDELEDSYASLQVMDSDDAAYQTKYDELIAQLTDLAGKKANYPSLKAEYLMGMIAFEKGEFQKALDSFFAVYGKAKDTYMGSLSLSNAAVAAEELDNSALALEYYTKLIDEFGFSAAEAPKALFAQGRLQESGGNKELAKATFQQLADQFPGSEFGKLAKNRLALL